MNYKWVLQRDVIGIDITMPNFDDTLPMRCRLISPSTDEYVDAHICIIEFRYGRHYVPMGLNK